MNDIDPRIIDLIQHANYLRDSGQQREAAELYTKILGFEPDLVVPMVERGLILVELGYHREAMADFQKAIQLDPDYGLAYYGRGWVRHYAGDYTGELEDANHGMKIDPDPDNKPLYMRRLASAASGMGNHQDAVIIYNHLIKFNPNDAGTRFNRAKCYVELNKLRKAMNDLNKCLEIDPGWVWALELRARIFWQRKQYEKALNDLNRVIKSEPTRYQAYYYRVVVNMDTGKKSAAKADLEFLAREADRPLRDQAKELLETL